MDEVDQAEQELNDQDPVEEKPKKTLNLKPEAIKRYKAQLKMAIAKRDRKFTPVANKTKRYYKGQVRPEWDEDETGTTVNMTFSNIEISKPSIFFRNPRIFVKPTQETFMLGNGEQLDGQKAASLLEDAANYVAYSIRLKRIIKQVRNDALILTYGVIFTGYEGEVGINEQGEEYVKEDSIFSTRVSPYHFLVDPECTDCLTFKDARWVAREIPIRYSDFKEDDWYENKDDVEASSTGYDEKITKSDDKVVNLIDFAGKNYSESDDAKRITLYEMWIKPTPAQKRKLKPGEPGGKVVVLSMSGKKAHKVIRWPYKIKWYPFRGLAFFVDNDEFYPISDIAQYEQQLDELSALRTAQLSYVKQFSKPKILIDKTMFDDEEEITKLNEDTSGPFIGVNGNPKQEGVLVIGQSSAPNDLFMVDTKVKGDIDMVSGNTDMNRGMPVPGVDTATEATQIGGLGGLRYVEKKDEMADFYSDVARTIVQLVKQFWTTDTMVRRLGTIQPEWSDNFSAEDIQIEDDVEVDIGEMVPINEVIRKKQALEFLELVGKGATEPGIKMKLAEEGYELNLAEAVKEAVIAFGIKNDKVIQRIDPDKYVKILKQLYLAKVQGAMGQGSPATSGKQLQTRADLAKASGSKGKNTVLGRGNPDLAHELSAANRGSGRQAQGFGR
jgi:hypothetical protein